MDLHNSFTLFFNGNNVFAISHIDTLILHITSSPGKIIRVFLSGWSSAAPIDEINQTVLGMQVCKEGDGGLWGS